MNTIAIPFHGNTLYLVDHDGEAYTPMKPIVEGMGLDWAAQFTKLKQRFSAGIAEIAIPSDGGVQKMTCLMLRKLAGWLYTISPNKVRAELRERIMQYQAECDDVLWDYWSKGKGARPAASGGDLFDSDYFTEAYRHAAPYFEQFWKLSQAGEKLRRVDAERMDRLVDGMLVSRLMTGRWILTFDSNGESRLRRMANEDQVLTSKEFAERISDPSAVPSHLLPDIAEAIMQRLMVCLPKN